MFRCISGCTEQAQLEALKAAGPALGLTLKAFYATLPPGVVVVGINYLKTKCCRIFGALLLADLIFLKGVDVGIAVVDGGGVAIGQHPLYDGSAAWRTAGM